MDESSEMAVMPRRRRRWFSYSLRSLLLLTAIAAVVLAVWVSRAERQRRAVAAIRDQDGEVQYDFEWSLDGTAPKSSRPGRLSKLLDVDYWADVAFVRMAPTTTDAGLVHLRALKNLKELHVELTLVTDTGLSHLSDLASLRVLYLSTRITDAGLVHLSALKNLSILNLSGTHITDAGLVHLSELTNLEVLGLLETKVTDTGCDRLQRVLPNCSILSPGSVEELHPLDEAPQFHIQWVLRNP